MTHRSPQHLLVLHAVRLLGFADMAEIADRAGVSRAEAIDMLDTASTLGWVQHSAFAGLAGWSLTEDGKAENERQLARERDQADPGGVVAAVHREFLPLNGRLLQACTDWQLRPTPADPLTFNDHTDPEWDRRVLDELTALSVALRPLATRLSTVLARFGGYDTRFDSALSRAREGRHEWIDRTTIDSCHRVWFQLHEDLLATLGIHRGAE